MNAIETMESLLLRAHELSMDQRSTMLFHLLGALKQTVRTETQVLLVDFEDLEHAVAYAEERGTKRTEVTQGTQASKGGAE